MANYRQTEKSGGSKIVGAFFLFIILCNIHPALGIGAAFIYILVSILKGAKKNAESSAPSRRSEVHSHDRLDPNIKMENGLDHYKIQLDGFLKAGIIDRKEYYVLLKKYSELLRTK